MIKSLIVKLMFHFKRNKDDLAPGTLFGRVLRWLQRLFDLLTRLHNHWVLLDLLNGLPNSRSCLPVEAGFDKNCSTDCDNEPKRHTT